MAEVRIIIIDDVVPGLVDMTQGDDENEILTPFDFCCCCCCCRRGDKLIMNASAVVIVVDVDVPAKNRATTFNTKKIIVMLLLLLVMPIVALVYVILVPVMSLSICSEISSFTYGIGKRYYVVLFLVSDF